jgi:hypothetical protein
MALKFCSTFMQIDFVAGITDAQREHRSMVGKAAAVRRVDHSRKPIRANPLDQGPTKRKDRSNRR